MKMSSAFNISPFSYLCSAINNNSDKPSPSIIDLYDVVTGAHASWEGESNLSLDLVTTPSTSAPPMLKLVVISTMMNHHMVCHQYNSFWSTVGKCLDALAKHPQMSSGIEIDVVTTSIGYTSRGKCHIHPMQHNDVHIWRCEYVHSEPTTVACLECSLASLVYSSIAKLAPPQRYARVPFKLSYMMTRASNKVHPSPGNIMCK